MHYYKPERTKEGNNMRKAVSILGGIFVPVILCVALIVTAFMSLDLIDDLQGNARVINYIGIVRGATQRLIKKELNHLPDDELIQSLDHILSGLSSGCGDLNLRKLESQLIAEGIEDGRQLGILKEYGVRTVQGFLFSRPIEIS